MNISSDAEQRLWAKTDKTKECWIWLGHKDRDGYGNIRIGGRKAMRTHRLSFFLATKIDPIGMLVCHHCDNPSCINPDHLYLGTALENNRDKINRHRENWAKGERVHNAKLTRDQVLSIFKEYKAGGVRQQDLAKKHNVSQSEIYTVLNGITWGHLGISPVKNMRNAPKPGLKVLNKNNEKKVFKEYMDGGVSQAKIAEKYGVSQQTVSNIVLAHKKR
jgi:transposase